MIFESSLLYKPVEFLSQLLFLSPFYYHCLISLTYVWQCRGGLWPACLKAMGIFSQLTSAMTSCLPPSQSGLKSPVASRFSSTDGEGASEWHTPSPQGVYCLSFPPSPQLSSWWSREERPFLYSALWPHGSWRWVFVSSMSVCRRISHPLVKFSL